MLYGNRWYMVSICSKLEPKKFRSKYDWVGKVIAWESRKRLKSGLLTTGKLELWDANGSLNQNQTTRPNVNKKKRLTNSWIFTDQADQSEGRLKTGQIYLISQRPEKQLWDMKVTVVPIVIRAFDSISQNREKKMGKLEIRGIIEIIQNIVLSKSISILRRAFEIEGDILPETPVEKSRSGVKNSQELGQRWWW